VRRHHGNKSTLQRAISVHLKNNLLSLIIIYSCTSSAQTRTRLIMLVPPGASVVGFPSVKCNGDYTERWTLSSLVLYFTIFFYFFGTGCKIWLNNKSLKPRIWDIPWFAALRSTVRATLTLTLVFYRQSGDLKAVSSNLAGAFVFYLINLIGMASLCYSSLRLLPCMGPMAYPGASTLIVPALLV